MKWLKRNNVELLLGISGSLFLINVFAVEDDDLFIFVIPFLVLGFILLYKRHFVQGCKTQSFEGFMANLSDTDDDELYEDAKEAVIEAGKVSTSFIQRKLRVGYSRAARLMDMLEANGVIGPATGVEPRKVIDKTKQ
jgi:DNA segregation ATPase FtsK/SpoIIIE-like protein